MIDEKKLIEEVKKHRLERKDSDTPIGVNVVIELIEQQPQADEWVPVEERLPELEEGTKYFKQSKEYLVTVQWWDGETFVDIGWYNENGEWRNDSKNSKVIAWYSRPLPQPYKKEGVD